ncbi:WXG100 family type VII secretion target [Janibacter anophelis]|uniref:WXG100 family type VII secretion target n=2 Tax=Janibacter anophelis TaxID=319054 RepID=UPI0039F0E8F3
MVRHISHGADVEQLDDIAVGLRRQGEKLADVGGRGAVLLEKLRVEWDGPDFEKFASRWRLAHRHIDEAEAALRTYSRKLLAEADAQRSSSGISSSGSGGRGDGGFGGGQGRGPGAGGVGFERMDRAEHGVGFERMDRAEHGVGFERMDRAEHGVGFERMDREGPQAFFSHVPGRGDELVYQLPGGPEHRVPFAETPFIGELTPVLPSLPGGEDLALPEADGPVLQHPQPWTEGGGATPFDRDQQWAPGQTASQPSDTPGTGGGGSADAPTQVPTTEGAHLTTASDGAGERSVAFNPLFEVLSGGFAANGSQMGGWLGGEADLQPWNR